MRRTRTRIRAWAEHHRKTLAAALRVPDDARSPAACRLRSAGVLACELTRRLAGCSSERRDAAGTCSRDGCAKCIAQSCITLRESRLRHRLPPVAPEFDTAALRANILDSQRNGQKYREFTQRAMAGGVQGYIAFLRGKRVTYWGRTGDQHTEWFPGSKR